MLSGRSEAERVLGLRPGLRAPARARSGRDRFSVLLTAMIAHPGEARDSVAYIISTARLGDFVRSLYFWMANLVAITLIARVTVSLWHRSQRPIGFQLDPRGPARGA